VGIIDVTSKSSGWKSINKPIARILKDVTSVGDFVQILDRDPVPIVVTDPVSRLELYFGKHTQSS
jgi:hypothetical protein